MMDREGFRNRMKQYKEAKGFDPLLKYWEWKLKYDSAPQPDSMPGQLQPDLPTVTSQPLDDRAHRWDNGYVQTNRQSLDSPYEDARYYDYRKPRFEFRKGDVHYSNPNLLKFMGRFGKVLRGGSLLGETILNLFPSEEAELIEDLRVKMDKLNKWLTGQEDIPKYDEGTGSVGMPSTTSADGRTKYVYYDPTMDLEYQNINLPEVTITGNKNAGKRLPMQVPEGSYKRFKTLGEIGKTVGSFLPVAGEMIDTYDLATDIKNKDWTNTAIRVGSYFIPNVFEKGANIIKQGVKNLRKHPKINIDTAYEITDKQWDRAYSKALQDNNLKEAQRLRDLHFLAKTNTTVKDASGMPIRTYHTVADTYDPNFTEFNPDIEGSHSAIYTSNDEIMSGSYTNKYVSEKELLANYPNLKEKGWVKDFSEMIPHYLDYNLWHPERLKSLYINLQHPLTIDADSHNWNYIPTAKLPADVYENINNLPRYMSTRDIEKIYKHFGYDGAVINNVRDYGGGKIIYTEFTPHTVYEIDNPTLLKSADAITYDDSGKVIPLSKRDDRKKKDFRYSWIIPAALSSTTINSDLKAMYAEGGEVESDPTVIKRKNNGLKVFI